MEKPAVTIIRHPRERLSKCSLEPLRGRPDLQFLVARPGFRFDATGYTLLELGAPPITAADRERPLLLLDSTWRWLPQLQEALEGTPVPRSIPSHFETAYPRVSKLFEDPAGGLASVEALYLARALVGEPDPSLLDGYRWKDEFLARVAPGLTG